MLKRTPGLRALLASTTVMATVFACSSSNEDAALVDTASGLAANNDDNKTGGMTGSSDFALGFTAQGSLPTFQIKGDYPALPALQTSAPPQPDVTTMRGGKGADAKAAAARWLEAIQSYVYEDMNAQSKDDNRLFRPNAGADIAKKRWYHMPWLHSQSATRSKPGRGRDAIWGLTREVDLRGPITWPRAAGVNCIAQSWGIGMFNEPGGYTIGKVFPKGSSSFDPKAGKFPQGSVAFKLLFTAASPTQLPESDGAWTIDAYVNGQGKCLSEGASEARVLTKMRHIQMDVMMKFGARDEDWIFASWVYDKNDKLHWRGMHPVGVQFGVKASETVVTSDHFLPNGFALPGEMPRLNGPADNPMSSCYSCHARAQWPELSRARLPFAPVDNNDVATACLLHEWKGEQACGLNAGCAERKDCIPAATFPIAPSGVALGMSLQFALALRNRSQAGLAP
jgi:hypothetical protein